MNPLQSDALVLFGASGDLAHKKIFPALYAMFRRRRLDVPSVGVERSKWKIAYFKAHVLDAISRSDGFDEPTVGRFTDLLKYVDGDYKDIETFKAMRGARGASQEPLFSFYS